MFWLNVPCHTMIVPSMQEKGRDCRIKFVLDLRVNTGSTRKYSLYQGVIFFIVVFFLLLFCHDLPVTYT